jgi:conjugative relaxase-like TrwC/TraI family protein
MVKISKAQGAGAAGNYFREEYSNGRESYYLDGEGRGEEGEIKGEYFGRLAEEMGLVGEVREEEFHRLIEGQDARTGEQLIRHVKSKEYTDKLGREIKTSEHRAGWDIVFSCPKSVSLVSGPGGDKRIAKLQREAVIETLGEIEKYIAGKDGHQGHRTGKMVAAIFQHDSARPDRETGYAAPDLHDHVFVMNMTKDEGGKFRAVEIDSIFRVRDYATQVHYAKLREKLEGIGYEFEINPKTNAPEIKGFSAEYLEENSKRRAEVLANEARMKQEAERAGFTIRGASLRGEAARKDRRGKKFDREEMRERHREKDAEHGFQARAAVERAEEIGVVVRSGEEIERLAKEAVTFAREHAFEREAVTRMVEIEKQALRRSHGRTTHEAIKAEIGRRIEAGELIEIERGRGPELTSKRMIELERDNIRRVIESRETQEPAIKVGTIGPAIEKAEEGTGRVLNGSQFKAVEEILASRDQIVGLSGVAGAGKTTTLATLNQILAEAGYEVRGFAPLTKAASQLGESGIRTTTLQKFLASSKEERGEGSRYFILDETSLAGAQSMNQFLSRLGGKDRVLLVGDERQHQSIEAGAVFEQMQRAGMRTAKLEKIVRQKTEEQREIVRRLSAKEVRGAVNQMIEQGQVTEIGERSERLKAIAADYCSNPNALVICVRNEERKEVNELIHRQLQSEGRIKRKGIETTILVDRNVTGAERKFAGAYQVGDIVRYRDRSKVYGVERGEYRRVIRVDAEQNTITVQAEKGKDRLTYDPKRLSGVSVYREEKREFCEGDKIQFRAPFQEQRIATSEIGTITKIKGGELSVKADKGRQVTVDLKEYRHLDLGYAVTSVSAQGQTAYRGIFSADTSESSLLLNQRAAYVANSRAIHGTRIYTNSIEELPGALDRRQNKETALKAVWETGEAQAKREVAAEERQEQVMGKERPTSLRPEREEVPDRQVVQQRQGQETVRAVATEELQRQAAQKEQPASLRLTREETLDLRVEQREQTPETARAVPANEVTGQRAKTETRKADRVASWLAARLAEDRTNVRETVRALEHIASESGGTRRNQSSEERASDVTAWVRYGQPIAEKLSVIPSLPLDVEIKTVLTGTFKSLHSLTGAYEHGQIPRGYAFQSMNIAREALSKVQPDLLTWELARSVSRVNDNFEIVAKMIEQGGRVGQLWQHGESGEHNLSVFTVRNLPGTYTAYKEGMDKTSMGFDERVSSFGYGDPRDSSRVKEIEYDPIKIRAEQIEQQRAQDRQIERGQEQGKDRGGYGYSR